MLCSGLPLPCNKTLKLFLKGETDVQTCGLSLRSGNP
jgi:hypothetical protein